MQSSRFLPIVSLVACAACSSSDDAISSPTDATFEGAVQADVVASEDAERKPDAFPSDATHDAADDRASLDAQPSSDAEMDARPDVRDASGWDVAVEASGDSSRPDAKDSSPGPADAPVDTSTRATGGQDTGGQDTGGQDSGSQDTGGQDSGGSDSGPGPAPDTVSYSGSFGAASGTYSLRIAGVSRDVRVELPGGATKGAPLVVGLHGTGGNADLSYSMQELGLLDGVQTYGFVLVAPASTDDGGVNADHEGGGTGWLFDRTDQNPDLLLVRATIQEARTRYGIDASRVYVIGHSNGAFFSYFVAASLADRVAAFAENAGGFIPCGFRVDCNATAPGAQSCAAIDSAGSTCAKSVCPDGSFPTAKPAGRMPPGYLVHAADDSTVSPYFTCRLAEHLGSAATVRIRPSGDHGVGDTFMADAWQYLRNKRLP